MTKQRTEELPVTLDQTQLMARGKELSEQVDRLKRMKDEHARQKKAMKRAEDELQAEVLRLTEIRKSGKELRPVPVENVMVRSSFTVQTVRLDTGEVIRERGMTKVEIADCQQSTLELN